MHTADLLTQEHAEQAAAIGTAAGIAAFVAGTPVVLLALFPWYLVAAFYVAMTLAVLAIAEAEEALR